MKESEATLWLNAVRDSVSSYRRMLDAILEQLTDAELFQHPAPGLNSVAIILRHLGGNLRSRWTDFLTTDGEKPDRNRDSEFLDWEGDRQSLVDHFDGGWEQLQSALDSLNEKDMDQIIFIRGEAHSIPRALVRSVTHVSYHVGQIAMVARMVHLGPWRWLTVAPGRSADHNKKTWGTAASRSFSNDDQPPPPAGS